MLRWSFPRSDRHWAVPAGSAQRGQESHRAGVTAFSADLQCVLDFRASHAALRISLQTKLGGDQLVPELAVDSTHLARQAGGSNVAPY